MTRIIQHFAHRPPTIGLIDPRIDFIFGLQMGRPGWRWFGFAALFFWVAYPFFPGVRELVDSLLWAANLTVTNLSETIV